MLEYKWPKMEADPAFDRLPQRQVMLPGVFEGDDDLAPRQYFRRPEIVLVLTHTRFVSVNVARSLQRMYRPVFGKAGCPLPPDS